MISGTMTAALPTAVPMIDRVIGISTTIRMMNGAERSRLIRPFRKAIKGLGSGRMPFESPVTSSTPSGRPIRIAKSVAISVIYSVTPVSRRKSRWITAQAFSSFSGV